MDLRIAVIEDTQRDKELLLSHLERYQQENNETNFEITAFDNSKSFFESFAAFIYDIIFLDIRLGDDNGIKIAKKIREVDNKVIIIFQTELEKYAIQGYEVEALDFMVKPITYSSLALRLTKAIKILAAEVKDQILLPTNCGFTKINVEDLVYVEVIGHKLFYHTVDSTIQVKGTMAATIKKLEKYGFLQCHNCYLVNPAKITKIEKYDCILGNAILQISHPKKKQFVNEFMNYMLTKRNR